MFGTGFPSADTIFVAIGYFGSSLPSAPTSSETHDVGNVGSTAKDCGPSHHNFSLRELRTPMNPASRCKGLSSQCQRQNALDFSPSSEGRRGISDFADPASTCTLDASRDRTGICVLGDHSRRHGFLSLQILPWSGLASKTESRQSTTPHRNQADLPGPRR